jgi:ribosomal protein S14
MATTAKIAKDLKKPKFKIRHRNRCWRCGGRAAFSANSGSAGSVSGSLR